MTEPEKDCAQNTGSDQHVPAILPASAVYKSSRTQDNDSKIYRAEDDIFCTRLRAYEKEVYDGQPVATDNDKHLTNARSTGRSMWTDQK